MKKIGFKSLSVFMFFSVFTMLSCQAVDKSSGCGAGWFIFKKNSLLQSSLRATTNMTFTPTFGMTSGTSGCDRHDIVQNQYKKVHYTEANFDLLLSEMAFGEGEYLQSYASLFGCHGKGEKAFTTSLQKNYHKINNKLELTPLDLVGNIEAHLGSSQNLSDLCSGSAGTVAIL